MYLRHSFPIESGSDHPKKSQGAVKMRWRIALRLLACLMLVVCVLASCHETVTARTSGGIGAGINTHTDPNMTYGSARFNEANTSSPNGSYAQLTFCGTTIVNASVFGDLEVEKVWQDLFSMPLGTDRLYLYTPPTPVG